MQIPGTAVAVAQSPLLKRLHQALPAGDSQEGPGMRKALFRRWDADRKGKLTLNEVEAALKATVKGVDDDMRIKAPLKRAFKAATDLDPLSDGVNLNFKEFHMLLVYIQRYVALYESFLRYDVIGYITADWKFSPDIVLSALPFLHSWGVEDTGILEKNPLLAVPFIDLDGSGTIDFEEFVDFWAVHANATNFAAAQDAPPQADPVWADIKSDLPVGDNAEATTRRKELFRRFDINRDGRLTFEEIEEGFRTLGVSDDNDLKESVRLALNAACEHLSDEERKAEGNRIKFKDFQCLLFYLQRYFDFFQHFHETDASFKAKDMLVHAFSLMRSWGRQNMDVLEADPEAILRQIDLDGSGYFSFSEFAEYCVKYAEKVSVIIKEEEVPPPRWQDVIEALPVEMDEASNKKRKELFRQVHSKADGKLTLPEFEQGLRSLLKGSSGVRNLGSPLSQAMQTAALLIPAEERGDHIYVGFKEFQMLLVYTKRFVLLYAHFNGLDQVPEVKVTDSSLKLALPLLRELGVQNLDAVERNLQAAFESIDLDGSGVEFNEFAEFCVHRVETMDLITSLPKTEPPSWETVSNSLPVDTDEKSNSHRKYLFRNFDSNGDGRLQVAELEAGIRELLRGTAMGELTEPLTMAFKAACNDDGAVTFREFRMLLFYTRRYVGLFLHFSALDQSSDKTMSVDELVQTFPLLRKWGMKNVEVLEADPAAIFKQIDLDGSGKVDFSEFAEFVIMHAEKIDQVIKDVQVSAPPSWLELLRSLPTGDDEAYRNKRKDMFRDFDKNGDGNLSLSEIEAGFRLLLGSPEGYGNLKEPLELACIAAWDHVREEEKVKSKSYVRFKEFRVFLDYVRKYGELYEYFDALTQPHTDEVSVDELPEVFPMLRNWGLKNVKALEADPAATFQCIDIDGSNSMSLQELADFCVRRASKFEPPMKQAPVQPKLWGEVSIDLPLGQDEDSKAKRKELFRLFDQSGNGTITVQKLEAGIISLQRGQTDVKDLRTPLSMAMKTTCEFISEEEEVEANGSVTFKYFLTLLIYTQRYVGLFHNFKATEASLEQQVYIGDLVDVFPLLRSWGVKNVDALEADPAAAFCHIDLDASGEVSFHELVDFCTKHADKMDHTRQEVPVKAVKAIQRKPRWADVSAGLPIGQDDESNEKLKVLFRQFDKKINGKISLQEVKEGFRLMIKGELDIGDLAQPLELAYQAAYELDRQIEDGSIRFYQFRMLFVYVQQFVAIFQHFCALSTLFDRPIMIEDFTSVFPILRSWGLSNIDALEAHPVEAFSAIDLDGSGDVSLPEFAKFCVHRVGLFEHDEVQPAVHVRPHWDCWSELEYVGKDAESADKRKELFRRFDPKGTGSLRLSQVQTGLNELFEVRFETPLALAFNATRDCWSELEQLECPDRIRFKDFGVFLAYAQRYVAVYLQFGAWGESSHRPITPAMLEEALPLLRSWGVENVDALAANLDFAYEYIDVDGSGQCTFEEFAEFCVRGLQKIDFSSNTAPVPVVLPERTWAEVSTSLPIGQDSQSLGKLKELFRRFDQNGRGKLTLPDLEAGFDVLLKENLNAPLSLAFKAARELMSDEEIRKSDETIKFKEFRPLLSYMQRYVAFFDEFDNLDGSIISVTAQAMETAVPLLRSWGFGNIKSLAENPEVTFQYVDLVGSGHVTFDEFAEFCVRRAEHLQIEPAVPETVQASLTWQDVINTLPVDQYDEQSLAKRKELFRRFDRGGNGRLRLHEIQAGFASLLKRVSGIRSLEAPLGLAFNCARDCIPEEKRRHSDDFIWFKEFCPFLVFSQRYVQLFQKFADKGYDFNQRITTTDELVEVLPLLKSWGFRNVEELELNLQGGYQYIDLEEQRRVTFNEFADFCVRHADRLNYKALNKLRKDQEKPDLRLIANMLPVAQDADSAAKRRELFRMCDRRGDGILYLNDVEYGLKKRLLEDNAVSVVRDPIETSFNAAYELIPDDQRSSRQGNFITFKQFQMFFLNLQRYIELLLFFQAIDKDFNNEVSQAEMEQCFPLLQAWGLNQIDEMMSDPAAAYQKVDLDNDGTVPFQEFADFVFRYGAKDRAPGEKMARPIGRSAARSDAVAPPVAFQAASYVPQGSVQVGESDPVQETVTHIAYNMHLLKAKLDNLPSQDQIRHIVGREIEKFFQGPRQFNTEKSRAGVAGEGQLLGAHDEHFAKTPGILFDAIYAEDELKALQILRGTDVEDLNAEDEEGRTALHLAASRGLRRLCDALLEHAEFKKADSTDACGWTALHYTAISGQAITCKHILDNPRFTWVNAKDHIDGTALHCAAAQGHVDVCCTLFSHARFSQVNARNRYGWSALHCAAGGGHVAVCNELLNHADFNQADLKNTLGCTALHLAARNGHDKACQCLLNSKRFTSANSKDCLEWTALHWGAHNAHSEVCRVLAKHPRFGVAGAPDKQGRTALDVAATTQVYDYLLSELKPKAPPRRPADVASIGAQA